MSDSDDEMVSVPRSLLLEAACYVRSAAVFEPEEYDEEATGHPLADRLFDVLGIDRTGPEHAHDRDPQ